MLIRFLGVAFAIFLASALILMGCAGGGTGLAALSVSSTAPASGALSVSPSTRITATFSEPMDVDTVTKTTFYASSPAGLLSGDVTCIGNTATLQLDSALPISTVITTTISTAVKGLSGRTMTANYVWTFTTGTTNDSINPTVSSTDPTNAETGVVLNKKISALFSEPMTASTINTTTFKLNGPAGAVAGTVTLLDNVASFKPTVNLSSNAVYTATITTGATDLSDNPLATDKIWSFTTGTNSDTTAPTVVSTDPATSATGVPRNKKVLATFSEEMDPATINTSTFTLKTGSSAAITASVVYGNRVATLSPAADLDPNTVYTATILETVKDAAGNPMAVAKLWSFSTATSGDVLAPTVLSTNPGNGATNVFRNASINATFSEAMNPNTLNTSTFSVAGVEGTVSYDTTNHIGTFRPLADLAPNTTYTARIESDAKDSAGNGLATPKIWTFTTGVQRSQTNLDLGAASTYAILAGSTVTNSGPTVINGDLGVSPGTAVTGFPPGLVNGAIHAGDSAAAQAKADLLAAQLDAAGRLGGQTLPGDLSGLTFTPGLYTNSTSVMLSAGNVTLDAQGDSNAIFIFQMGSTLTTSPGTQVVLAGGAKASNIYWSVGTSATLGVNSIFKGAILAEASISVNTGAVHTGVLLTKIGAVTLQSNSVTRSLAIRP